MYFCDPFSSDGRLIRKKILLLDTRNCSDVAVAHLLKFAKSLTGLNEVDDVYLKKSESVPPGWTFGCDNGFVSVVDFDSSFFLHLFSSSTKQQRLLNSGFARSVVDVLIAVLLLLSIILVCITGQIGLAG